MRKALGATRRDILIQFLIEAATLTGIGGLLGVVVGLVVGRGVTILMNVQADAPLLQTVIAVVVSVGIGVVFGVVPARGAAGSNSASPCLSCTDATRSTSAFVVQHTSPH